MACRTYRSDRSFNCEMDYRRKPFKKMLVSSVIGFASAFLSGQFDASTILKSIAVAFSVSQVFYDQVFKDLFNNPRE